jgi:hypothetical protein
MSGQVGSPDHPHPQAGNPAAGRRQVPDLEYRHLPTVTGAPLEVPAGGRLRLRGRHHQRPTQWPSARDHPCGEVYVCPAQARHGQHGDHGLGDLVLGHHSV